MEYWCHLCKRTAEITPQMLCSRCLKNFVEEVEDIEQHPRNFVPYGSNPRNRMMTELILMPNIRSLRNLSFQNEPDAAFDALIHQLMQNDTNRYGPPPAAKDAVAGLKEIVITQETITSRGILHTGVDEFGDKIDSERIIIECSVCKEELLPEDTAIDMPCLHLFHKECIVSWLGSHNNCPVCRFEFPTDDPDYENRRLRK